MRFSRAAYRGPVPNMSPNGMGRPIRGLVLHIIQGSIESADIWFHNAKAQASAHFGNAKDGRFFQWVDTDDKAWAEAAGNGQWISVENEGHAGDSLTPQQIENIAQLYVWLHAEYGVPIQSTDDPNGEGLCWHGAGGAAWGGHTACPGEPIKAQRPAILARVNQIIHPKPPIKPKPGPTADEVAARDGLVQITRAAAYLCVTHKPEIAWYTFADGKMHGHSDRQVPFSVTLFAYQHELDAAHIPHAGA